VLQAGDIRRLWRFARLCRENLTGINAERVALSLLIAVDVAF